MRFLVDENLPIDVVEVLEAAGHQVIYVARTQLHLAPDTRLNAFAAHEDCIIVTRDLDFPLRDTASVPGVILVRVPDHFRRRQIGDVMRAFLQDENFQTALGRVTVVSPGRSRWRDLADA